MKLPDFTNSKVLKITILLGASLQISACGMFERRNDVSQLDKNPQQVKEVIMIAPDGDEESFTVSEANKLDRETRKDISKIGVSFAEKDYLCSHAKETVWRLERQVELKMELGSLIEDLRMQKSPRQLSDADLEQIERVQVCAPYIMDLKIISKLLQGYDLKKMRF